MALINCRECKKLYSDLAEQCPVCGCPTIFQKDSGKGNIQDNNQSISPLQGKNNSPASEYTDRIPRESNTPEETASRTYARGDAGQGQFPDLSLKSRSTTTNNTRKNNHNAKAANGKTAEANQVSANIVKFSSITFLFVLLIFFASGQDSQTDNNDFKSKSSSGESKKSAGFDPAIQMQKKVVYYPDSRYSYLNTKDYKLVTGDLARIQYRMLRNRRNAQVFPTVLIGNGRWSKSQCNSSLPTLGLYMYSRECKNLITVNFWSGSIAYEHQIEVITTIAHEWGHHLINMSGRRVSGIQNELLSDCFAGVYLAYLDKYKLVSKNEIDQTIRMMGQIGNTHGTGVHGTPAQRTNGIIAGALFMSDKSNRKGQAMWDSYCKGLENIIDLNKGLP